MRLEKPRPTGLASPLISDNMSVLLIRRDALKRAGGFQPAGQRPLRTCDNTEFYLRLTQLRKMARNRRLSLPQDGSNFAHRQLLPAQQAETPQPGDVPQQAQAFSDRGKVIHRSIVIDR